MSAGAGCAREADASLAGDGGATALSTSSAATDDAGADVPEVATPVQSPAGGSGGGPATCPERAPFHAFEYARVAVQPGACEADEVEAFLAACGDRGTGHACDEWMAANTGGGGAGTPCGNCILPLDDSGASFHTQNEYFGPNYGACLDLLDPAGSAGCIQPYDALLDCDGLECDDCTLPMPYDRCAVAANDSHTICGSVAQAMRAACTTELGDGGVVERCTPAAGTGLRDPDWRLVIGMVCGPTAG